MARRKVKLKPGEHRIGLSRRKVGESKLFATPFCKCGWRGEETPNTTGALEQFDNHMTRLKRGEES